MEGKNLEENEPKLMDVDAAEIKEKILLQPNNTDGSGTDIKQNTVAGLADEQPQKLEDMLNNTILKGNFMYSPDQTGIRVTGNQQTLNFTNAIGQTERINIRPLSNRDNSVKIPATDHFSSSPEITFGQPTLTMVEEFMATEGSGKAAKKKSKSGFLRWFSCC